MHTKVYSPKELMKIAMQGTELVDAMDPPFQATDTVRALTDMSWLATQPRITTAEPVYDKQWTTRQKLALHSVFCSIIFSAVLATKTPPSPHRKDLPPPPKGWNGIKRHSRHREFRAAAQNEWNKQFDIGTFKWTKNEEVPEEERELLPGLPLT